MLTTYLIGVFALVLIWGLYGEYEKSSYGDERAAADIIHIVFWPLTLLMLIVAAIFTVARDRR